MITFDEAQILGGLSALLMPLFRLLGLFSSAPLLSSRNIPVRYRVMAALSLAGVGMVEGSGQFVCNGRTLEEYFPNKLHQQLIKAPLVLIDRDGQFDIHANLTGGGPTGQAGAFRLAIARALNIYNPADRPALKKAGFLTRDARAVERKKAGLHKARRAPQYSKR